MKIDPKLTTTKSGDPGKQKEERLNEGLQRRFPVNHLSRVKMIFFLFLSLFELATDSCDAENC